MTKLSKVGSKIRALCPICGYQSDALDFRVKCEHKYASIYDSYKYICPNCNEELSLKIASKRLILSAILAVIVVILFFLQSKLVAMLSLLVWVVIMVFYMGNGSSFKLVKKNAENK